MTYVTILIIVTSLMVLVQWIKPSGPFALWMHGLTAIPLLFLSYAISLPLRQSMPCLQGDASSCKIRSFLLLIMGIILFIHALATLYRFVMDLIQGPKPMRVYPGVHPVKKHYFFRIIPITTTVGERMNVELSREQFEKVMYGDETVLTGYYWPRTRIVKSVVIEGRHH